MLSWTESLQHQCHLDNQTLPHWFLLLYQLTRRLQIRWRFLSDDSVNRIHVLYPPLFVQHVGTGNQMNGEHDG